MKTPTTTADAVPANYTAITAPRSIVEEMLMGMGHRFYLEPHGCTVLVAAADRAGAKWGEVVEADWAVAEAAAALPVHTCKRRELPSWAGWRQANGQTVAV